MKHFAVCALLILPLVSGGFVPPAPTRHFVAYEIQSTHNVPQMEAIVQKMQAMLQKMIPEMSALADSVAVPDMSIQSDAGVLPDMSLATDADETPRRRSAQLKAAPIVKAAAPWFSQIPDMSIQADAGLIPDISVATDAAETPKRTSFGVFKTDRKIAGILKSLPQLTKVSGAKPVEIMTQADADLVPDMSVASDADVTPRKLVPGIKSLPKFTKVSGAEPVEIVTHADVTPRKLFSGIKSLPKFTKVSGAEPVEIMSHADADLVPDMSVASDGQDKAANQPDISVASDAKFDSKKTLAELLAKLH